MSDEQRRRMLKIEPIASDGNYEAQLVAAMQRIQKDVSEIRDSLDVLIVTLALEGSSRAGTPK